MHIIKKSLSCSALWAGLLMLCAFSVSLWWFDMPLLHAGDDAFYHMLRIESLYQQLSHGLWRQPLNMLFFQGAGYASTTCYPDIFLYIPALLRFSGLEIGQCFTLFIMLCMGCSLLTAFWAGKSITGSSFVAAVVAILYALCQYKMDCSYARAALGEIQAFVFLPLVAAALYDLAFKQFSQPWLMVLAFGGLMLTHTLSCFVAVLLAAMFCLIFIRRVWAHVPRLCVMAALTLGLTAFYWLPCMELLFRMDLHAAHPWTFAVENAVDPAGLFSNVLLGEAKAGLGWELLLLCLPIVAMRGGRGRRMAWFCLIGALLLSLAATRLFPWEKSGALGVIQFPWRFYSFASLLYAFAAACAWHDLVLRCVGKGQVWARAGALAFITAVMIVAAVRHAPLMDNRYFDLGKDYFAQGAETVYVGGGEWLPFSLDLPQLKIRLRACAEQASAPECPRAADNRQEPLPLLRSADSTKLAVALDSRERLFVDVPLVWYYGYSAVFIPLLAEDKSPEALQAALHKAVQADAPVHGLSLRVSDAGNGFCRVWLDTDDKGKTDAAHKPLGAGIMLVHYAGTRVQHWAGWGSLALCLGVVIAIAVRRRRQ